MAKYRLLNRSGLTDSFWVVGKIYDSKLQRNPDWNSVQHMADRYPNSWELIKEEPMCTEKTIIGYKLNHSEYKKVVVAALGLNSVFEPNIIVAGMIGYYIPKIKELGIMDWFEPIYEKAYPEITINGYKGEFFDWGVKFGCAEIGAGIFRELYRLKSGYSNKEIESVTIGRGVFTKDQIKKIAEYYLNK